MCSDTSERVYCDRGKPLSEVISNISRSSLLSPREASEKSASPSAGRLEMNTFRDSTSNEMKCCETKTSHESHSSGLSKSSDRFSSSFSRLGSTYKLSSPPPLSKRFSSPPRSSLSPPGSSMHISWDKSGKMQTTLLDSPARSRSSQGFSPSKYSSKITPTNSDRLSVEVGSPSPILIPETPDSTDGRKMLGKERGKRDKHRIYYEGLSSPVHSREGAGLLKHHALLNELLSEEETKSSSMKHRLDSSTGRTDRERRSDPLFYAGSSPSKSRAHFSPVSPLFKKHAVSPHKSPTHGVKKSWHSGLKAKTEYRRPKQNVRDSHSKDPVWDFIDEEIGSPTKSANRMSRRWDRHSSPGTSSSRDRRGLGTSSWSRAQYRSRSTSEDDNLPLIRLKYKDQASGSKSKPSTATSHVTSPSHLTSPKHLTYPRHLTSPSHQTSSRPWRSPEKRSWMSYSPKNKPCTVVISPWKPVHSGQSWLSPHKDSSSSEIRRQWEGRTLEAGSHTTTTDEDDNVPLRKLSKMRKVQQLRELFGPSSDEDDDDNANDFAERKRKIDEDVLSNRTESDGTSKRRKVSNMHHDAIDDQAGASSRSYHKSKPVHKTHTSANITKWREIKHSSSPESKDKPSSSSSSSSTSHQHRRDGHTADSTSSRTRTRGTRHKHSSSRVSIIGTDYLQGDSYEQTEPAKATSTLTNSSNEASSSVVEKIVSGPLAKEYSRRRKRFSPIKLPSSGGESLLTSTNIPDDLEGRRRPSPEGQMSPDLFDVPSTGHTPRHPVNLVDDSDDEVVMVDSFSYAASLVQANSKKRKSRKKTKAQEKQDPPVASVGGATGGVMEERDAVSPSILNRFNQMDEDEAMARRLQEEFDAEMARSVQQRPERAPDRARDETDNAAAPQTTCAGNAQRPPPLPDAGTFGSFNPSANISVEISSETPVNVNWNYDFQPASSVLGYEDGLPSLPTLNRRGTNRRGHNRRRNSDDRPAATADGPPLSPMATRRGLPHYHHTQGGGGRQRLDSDEWIRNFQNELFAGQNIQWFNYPELDVSPIPPIQPGRQPGRGRARNRGRRRNHRDYNLPANGNPRGNDGSDYDALLQLADRLGPAVDKRLTQTSIERLPTFLFCKDQHGGSEEESSCPICMEDYVEGAELRRLPCFHGYHKNCIDVWLKKSQDPMCPICRVEVRIE